MPGSALLFASITFVLQIGCVINAAFIDHGSDGVNPEWFVPGNLPAIYRLPANRTIPSLGKFGLSQLSIGTTGCPFTETWSTFLVEQNDDWFTCLDLITGAFYDYLDYKNPLYPHERDNARRCAYYYKIRDLKFTTSRYDVQGLSQYLREFSRKISEEYSGLVCGIDHWEVSPTKNPEVLAIFAYTTYEARAFSKKQSDLVAEMKTANGNVIASTRMPLVRSNQRVPHLQLIAPKLHGVNVTISYGIVSSGAGLYQANQTYVDPFQFPP